MAQQIACGIDMIRDERMEEHLSKPELLDKIFHPSEQKEKTAKKLAGIFAIKEAAIKALDISADHWLDIEVSYRTSGKPEVALHESIRPSGMSSIDCSVSHEDGMTIAMVTILHEE